MTFDRIATMTQPRRGANGDGSAQMLNGAAVIFYAFLTRVMARR
jgi:hypothetical protein